MPTGLGAPSEHPEAPLAASHEVPWLQPAPNSMIGGDPSDPASIVTSRESMRLALIAVLQHLPPKQRAVLILRDVLKWRAAEVAEQLNITTAAVNSALQRAHAQLELVAPAEEKITEPDVAEQREMIDKYVAAFENYDVAGIVELFTRDAIWEMPPFLTWVRGAEHIGRLISANCPAHGPGDQRMAPTTANGQPAFGLYMLGEDGVHRAFQIQVLALTREGVSHASVFFDVSLFPKFGLPETLPRQVSLPRSAQRPVPS